MSIDRTTTYFYQDVSMSYFYDDASITFDDDDTKYIGFPRLNNWSDTNVNESNMEKGDYIPSYFLNGSQKTSNYVLAAHDFIGEDGANGTLQNNSQRSAALSYELLSNPDNINNTGFVSVYYGDSTPVSFYNFPVYYPNNYPSSVAGLRRYNLRFGDSGTNPPRRVYRFYYTGDGSGGTTTTYNINVPKGTKFIRGFIVGAGAGGGGFAASNDLIDGAGGGGGGFVSFDITASNFISLTIGVGNGGEGGQGMLRAINNISVNNTNDNVNVNVNNDIGGGQRPSYGGPGGDSYIAFNKIVGTLQADLTLTAYGGDNPYDGYPNNSALGGGGGESSGTNRGNYGVTGSTMNLGFTGGNGNNSSNNISGNGGGISLSNFFRSYVVDGGNTGANTLPRALEYFYQGAAGYSTGYGKGGNGGFTTNSQPAGLVTAVGNTSNGGKAGFVRVYFVI